MSEVDTGLLLADALTDISPGQKPRPEYVDDLQTLYKPLPEVPKVPVVSVPSRVPYPQPVTVLPRLPEPTLDDIRAELDRALQLLSTEQLRYVEARTRLGTDVAVGREWGKKHPSSAIVAWKRSREPDVLKQVIEWLQIEKTAGAQEILGRHLMRAADVKVGGLDSVDERLRQSAATEILDRALGKPVQRVDKKSKSEQLVIHVDF